MTPRHEAKRAMLNGFRDNYVPFVGPQRTGHYGSHAQVEVTDARNTRLAQAVYGRMGACRWARMPGKPCAAASRAGGNDAGQVGIALAAARKRTASAGSGQSQKAAYGRSPHRQAREGGQAAEQPGLR
jgi:hypothetical protein